MRKYSRFLAVLVVLVLCTFAYVAASGMVFAQTQPERDAPAKAVKAKPGAAPGAAADTGPKAADPYASEVSRKGNTVIVTAKFADLVREDNSVILSRVTTRQRVDKEGKVVAYELVEVDKGSAAEKMGFRPGDRLTAVNGVPARDIEKKQKSLEQEKKFTVDVIRKGKKVRIIVEIR